MEKIIPGSFLYFDSAMQAVGCTLRIEPPCAHEWGQWTDKPGYEADCDTPGKQIRECGLCHEIEEKDVSAEGHSFTSGSISGARVRMGSISWKILYGAIL